MSFQLPKFTTVLLRSLNVRAEMHGSDPVPAVDIGFRLVGSNDLLLMFDRGLKPAFYVPVTNDGAEPELDGIDPLTSMPQLRSTSIDMPISLIRDYIGVNLVLDYGLGGKSNIELFGDLDNFKVNMKEGGTVEIDFRFQSSGIKDGPLGKLGGLIKHDVKITLMPSAEADGTQERVPGTSPFKYTAGPGGIVDNNPPKDKDATDLFVEGSKPDKTGDAGRRQANAKKPAAKKPAAKKVAAKKAAKK